MHDELTSDQVDELDCYVDDELEGSEYYDINFYKKKIDEMHSIATSEYGQSAYDNDYSNSYSTNNNDTYSQQAQGSKPSAKSIALQVLVFLVIFCLITGYKPKARKRRKVGDFVTVNWSGSEGEVIDTSNGGSMVRDVSSGRVNTYSNSEIRGRKM